MDLAAYALFRVWSGSENKPRYNTCGTTQFTYIKTPPRDRDTDDMLNFQKRTVSEKDSPIDKI